MGSITLIGGSIIVLMSAMTDVNGTVKLVVAIITIRGITWLCEKITQSINLDCSQIINMAGWSIAGISIVGIIKNAIHSPIIGSISKANDSMISLFNNIDKFTAWMDKANSWFIK